MLLEFNCLLQNLAIRSNAGLAIRQESVKLCLGLISDPFNTLAWLLILDILCSKLCSAVASQQTPQKSSNLGGSTEMMATSWTDYYIALFECCVVFITKTKNVKGH